MLRMIFGLVLVAMSGALVSYCSNPETESDAKADPSVGTMDSRAVRHDSFRAKKLDLASYEALIEIGKVLTSANVRVDESGQLHFVQVGPLRGEVPAGTWFAAIEMVGARALVGVLLHHRFGSLSDRAYLVSLNLAALAGYTLLADLAISSMKGELYYSSGSGDDSRIAAIARFVRGSQRTVPEFKEQVIEPLASSIAKYWTSVLSLSAKDAGALRDNLVDTIYAQLLRDSGNASRHTEYQIAGIDRLQIDALRMTLGDRMGGGLKNLERSLILDRTAGVQVTPEEGFAGTAEARRTLQMKAQTLREYVKTRRSRSMDPAAQPVMESMLVLSDRFEQISDLLGEGQPEQQAQTTD